MSMRNKHVRLNANRKEDLPLHLVSNCLVGAAGQDTDVQTVLGHKTQ